MVKALVEATPTSGRALVNKTCLDCLAAELVGTLKIARVTTGENGNNLTIEAGQFESGTEGNGGSLTLKGGGADSGDGTGGHLILQPGAGDNDGTLYIKGSSFQLDSTSAKLAFRSAIGAGTGNGTFSDGSTINTNTVQAYSNAILNIYGKSGTTAYPVNIIGGGESGDDGSGAGVTIAGGTSGGDSGNGGDVTIQGGSGETTNGKVILGGSNTLEIDVNSIVNMSGDLTVDTNRLKVDTALNKVGINHTPVAGSNTLHVNGGLTVESGGEKGLFIQPGNYEYISIVYILIYVEVMISYCSNYILTNRLIIYILYCFVLLRI